eukprot:18660-Heterococcus_DN1.PRE.2
MATAPYQGSFNAGEEKIEEDSVQDITTSSLAAADDGESALAADLDQALSTASVVCKHADDEKITAVCCLTTCTDDHKSIVVTATTTAEGTHSLQIWHTQRQEVEFDREYRQVVPETILVAAPVTIVPEAHPNVITSICAVPLRGSSSKGAAFVTCSRGNGTLTVEDHGTIRLWSSDGTPLKMELKGGGVVEELNCNASVSKVIVTVNRYRETLIAACFTARRTGIEIWNTTTGTYNIWDAGNKRSRQFGCIATMAFSLNGNEIISGCADGRILRYSTLNNFEEPQYTMVTNTVTHMVYSAEGQYLAAVSSENEINIWRAQFNGKCEHYALLAGYEQKDIVAIRFKIIAAGLLGEKRVILLALYNDGQHYLLNTYDILTQQEIREPVTVAHIQDIPMSDLLVDISGDMQLVVSATRGASMGHTLNLVTCNSSIIQQLSELLGAPNYADAVKLFKQHPSAAFQPACTAHTLGRQFVTTLITQALSGYNGNKLLCLLDPDKAVLDDNEDDIRWKLALCTVTAVDYHDSPIQQAIGFMNSHAASLILKVVAIPWNSAVSADAIYMPDLIDLLKAFPTLAVFFLTDQVKLIQIAKPFYLTLRHKRATRCKPQWVRAAASLQAVSGRNWDTITQEHLKYMAETYVTDLVQSIIERFLHLDETAQFWYDTMAFSHYVPGTIRKFIKKAKVVQHAIPVRNCNTIKLLEAAVKIAESQDSALLFKSEWQVVIAWTLQGIKCIIFTGYFVVQEYRELMYEGFRVWLWDAWNIMDVTAYGLIYAGVIVQACSNPEQPAHSKAANIINAIAAVLLWFKLLHYMRPYKATGVLVSMIFKILMKIRAFMLVLAIVVVGFATAFYSVLNTDKASSNNASVLKYNTVGNALRTSFSYMLGTYELAVLDVGPSDVIEHSYMMEKTKEVILSNIKLSYKRKAQLEKTADKWKDRIDVITTAVSGSIDKVQADVNSVRADVNNVKTNVLELTNSVKADVEGVSTEVTALKQEVSDLKSIIQEILHVVKATAQQISAASTADTDEHSVSETAPTTLETTATAASIATEEPTVGTKSGTAAVATSTS